MDSKKIADLLFPNLKWTTEEIEAKYKPRNLNDTQVVSRYAPSPTGYMHVGNFFQMFISYNLTRVTDGRFFLRIEDTDSKREKKDATKVIQEILSRFGIKFNEYQTLDGEESNIVGTINGLGTYSSGTTVELEAVANAGYVFVGWESEDIEIADATNEQITIEMPSKDITATAN